MSPRSFASRRRMSTTTVARATSRHSGSTTFLASRRGCSAARTSTCSSGSGAGSRSQAPSPSRELARPRLRHPHVPGPWAFGTQGGCPTGLTIGEMEAVIRYRVELRRQLLAPRRGRPKRSAPLEYHLEWLEQFELLRAEQLEQYELNRKFEIYEADEPPPTANNAYLAVANSISRLIPNAGTTIHTRPATSRPSIRSGRETPRAEWAKR